LFLSELGGGLVILKNVKSEKGSRCLLGLLLLLLVVVVVVLNWLRVIAAAAVVVLMLKDGEKDDGGLNALDDDEGKDDSPVFVVGIIIIMEGLLLFQAGRVLAPLLFIIMELLFIDGIAAAGYIVALPLGYIMLLLLLLLPIMLPIFIALLLLLLLGCMPPIAPAPPRPAIKPDDDTGAGDDMCVNGV